MNLGNQLQNLCEKAEKEIILIAPFIKVQVLKQLLNDINPQINITCITRWRIEEIVMGVSDIEVWNIIKSFPQGSLWLRNDLHAKYYRVDQKCLIGSANLTANALNWSNNPNLELTVLLDSQDFELIQFEQEVFNNCIQVDQQLYDLYSQAISEELLTRKENRNLINELVKIKDITLEKQWLPTLRNPEDLYLAYCHKWEQLTNIASQNAIDDLNFFNISDNLSQALFKAHIGIHLLEKPIIQKIDDFVKIPRRFGEVKDYLKTLPCAKKDDFNPQISWQTLMRWLLYFLPSRYSLSVPNYSEVFYRN
jgi:hypothetical protein